MTCREHRPISEPLVASGSTAQDEREVQVGMILVRHDWSEAHHDMLLQNGAGRRLNGGRLPDGMEAVRRFHEMVAAYTDDPAEVKVARETDRGLFVGALVAAGYG